MITADVRPFTPFASNPAAKNNDLPPIVSPDIMSFNHVTPIPVH